MGIILTKNHNLQLKDFDNRGAVKKKKKKKGHLAWPSHSHSVNTGNSKITAVHPSDSHSHSNPPPRPDGGSHDIGKKILIPALPIWCQIPVEPVRSCRTRQRKLGQIWLWRSKVGSLAQSRWGAGAFGPAERKDLTNLCVCVCNPKRRICCRRLSLTNHFNWIFLFPARQLHCGPHSHCCACSLLTSRSNFC